MCADKLHAARREADTADNMYHVDPYKLSPRIKQLESHVVHLAQPTWAQARAQGQGLIAAAADGGTGGEAAARGAREAGSQSCADVVEELSRSTSAQPREVANEQSANGHTSGAPARVALGPEPAKQPPAAVRTPRLPRMCLARAVVPCKSLPLSALPRAPVARPSCSALPSR